MDGAVRAGAPGLEVGLLGPLEVRRDGAVVVLGGLKPRTLLAVLALDPGRAVSVDGLVEALWPGEPPGTAAHAVQVYVSQLRKALGAVLATRAQGYELELDPERVDAHRFARLAQEGRAALEAEDPAAAERALREALALWRGPALADFLYEPFAQAEVARLEELRTVVLEARIDADLALGRHAELVSELEALVQAQPLRERPRAQLMLALYRSARQADALAAYRAARDTLVGELGLEPGPELRELEAAILRQDESLAVTKAPVALPAMQFRRLASILFCDVVDSMAIAEGLDAEALGAVQRRYFEMVSAAILRHGGTVERYAGDAVMAVFGIPVSHEDHALRAARAALEIRAGVGVFAEQLELEHGFGLGVRIGIAAGEVVSVTTEGRQRFVAGDAVGVAAGLQHAAEPGGIVVGNVVARLIDHAARLERLGELDVTSRKSPIEMFRLVELAPEAPTFGRRTDAAFVGRKRELAALRRSLRRAVDSRSARVAFVVAPAGVGKSRLASELTRRARGVTALRGRCLSYGEGITYWPLREVLSAAKESQERTAILEALEAEAPPPAAEIAWLFRRFCEASARERPLVLVFDDLHWAEPTLLELVEHLAERGEGPIAIFCLAREELLEKHPALLEPANVDLVELDVLSGDDTEALVDALGGSVLESDQRVRLVETAEGNPLFVEQLLALALEGGLAGDRVPETVQALLAARLDRLGPGERAVLERGAVVGREFTADDVVALLDPQAAPTADVHLESLADRGFVRALGDGAFGFRHVLVQEAAYRAAPKRVRAELHERYADRLDDAWPDLPDLDEFVGYHLEQAHHLRREVGESGRLTDGLAHGAGRRLGAAGFRALKRGDMPATVGLLGRAVSLLPPGDEERHELMCELGIAQFGAGDAEGAHATYVAAIEGAEAEGQRRVELRARIEAAYGRLLAEPEGSARDLLAVAEEAVPTFEALGDERSLARAWLLIGYVRGGIYGNHAAWQEAEEKALGYYRSTAFPPATCVGQIAAAMYWGPTPVTSAIERCVELLEDEAIGLFGRALVTSYLGGMTGQTGRFERARELITEAEAAYHELGATSAAITTSGTVRADTELLAADLGAAEATLREQCDFLQRIHDRSHLAVRAAKLAEVLYRQGRLDEARSWAGTSRSNAARDDQSVQLVLGAVEARLLATSGALSEARELAEEVVRLADGTDGLNQIAAARLALGDVLARSGHIGEAERVMTEAIALYTRKGNSAGADRAREMLNLAVTA